MPLEDSLTELYSSKAQEAEQRGDLKGAIAYLRKIPQPDDIIRRKLEELKGKVKAADKPKKEEKKPGYSFTETFDDIIGLDYTKDRIKLDILQPLKNPEAYDSIYHIKKGAGILLYGAPGTGKTSLIRAISGEAKLKVILARIDEIKSPYTAETERNMHAKFEEARANAPCILFFDEVDALGAKRESLGGEGSAEVLKAAINVFITEMDGIQSKNENVYVMGATNAPWSIDAALKRSGRFDNAIYIPLPNRRERKKLFKYYMRDVPKGRINYGRLARITERYPPADIRKICQMATKLAIASYVRNDDKKVIPVSMKHLLKILRSKEANKSSIDEWFSNSRKKLLGTVRIQRVGKKRIATSSSAELEADERARYKELVSDILRAQKRKGIEKAIKLFSLYIS